MDSEEKRKFRQVGFHVGFHVGIGLLSAVALVLVLSYGLSLLGNAFGLSVDDSDRDGWNRSGARIVTDYKTGVQYFRVSGGGITPRLNPDGSLVTVPRK